MITNIIEDFTSVWSVFHHVDRETALRQINGGHCGVAAYAISEVLKAKGIAVEHYCNCWHVWNRIGGVDYDTLRPEGYEAPVCELWGAPSDCPIENLDVYLRNSTLEALVVRAFLKRHKVPVPALVDELVQSKPPIAKRTLKGWKMVKSQRVINNLHYRYLKVRRLGPNPIPFTPIRPDIKKIEMEKLDL